MLVYRPEKGGLRDRYLDFDKFDINIFNKVRLNILGFTLKMPNAKFNLLEVIIPKRKNQWYGDIPMRNKWLLGNYDF